MAPNHPEGLYFLFSQRKQRGRDARNETQTDPKPSTSSTTSSSPTRRLKESPPGHIGAGIRSSNCTSTTTCTSIYACCTHVCTHPISLYDQVCSLNHLYMPNCHVLIGEIESFKRFQAFRCHRCVCDEIHEPI